MTKGELSALFVVCPVRLATVLFICISTCGNCDSRESEQQLTWSSSEPGPFGEQIRWATTAAGVRVMVDAPAASLAPDKRRKHLVIYATPNGNTLEQTLGCAKAPSIDWHFDIQHVAAQTRKFRELAVDRETVLAVVQSGQLSWPAFCASQPNAPELVHDLVHALIKEFDAESATLSGHSGGGSFIFDYINASTSISELIERIVFLDANYSYSEEAAHGDKLVRWVRGSPARRLIVMAYDDREITLNGKKVVGSDGGTFRASDRMRASFHKSVAFKDEILEPFQYSRSADQQIQFIIHPNPENRILHTALVGDMNGLLNGLTIGTEYATQLGPMGGPRAYEKWIQNEPFREPATRRAQLASAATEVMLPVPKRSAAAIPVSKLVESLMVLPIVDRELTFESEVLAGNLPENLRKFFAIEVDFIDQKEIRHAATYYVMRDYLAIGGDGDSLRIPLTPGAALSIGDKLGCTLLTKKVSDDIHSVSKNALNPQPLTEDRESLKGFLKHQQMIEEQLQDRKLDLIVGIKKDVVWTNRLNEKTHRVAIYGWHYPHGQPIQSLYVGHVDRYVDYSHGVRFLANRIWVDGAETTVAEVLSHPTLHPLLSDEGPMDIQSLRRNSEWNSQPRKKL